MHHSTRNRRPLLRTAWACALFVATAIDARAEDASAAFDLAPTNIASMLSDAPIFDEPDPSWSLGVGAHAGGLIGLAGLPLFGPTIGASARARYGRFAIEPRIDASFPQLFLIALPYAQVSVPVLFEVPISVFRPYIGVGPTFAVGTVIGHVEPPVPIYTIPGAEGVAGFGIAVLPHVELRAQGRLGVGLIVQNPRVPFGMLAATLGAALTL